MQSLVLALLIVASLAPLACAAQPAATAPATSPQPLNVDATGVRADTLAALRQAIDGGERLIQVTAAIPLNNVELDLKGATVDLVTDVRNAHLFDCRGRVMIRNGTLRTPAQRVCIYASYGASVTAEDLTIASGSGQAFAARTRSSIVAKNVQASTITNYFAFADDESYIELTDCGVSEGSSGEAPLRFAGGRYRIVRGFYSQDKYRGFKPNVLRGDAPSWPDGSPGGVVEDATFVGQVALGPLSGDDGGQMIGVDRFNDARGNDIRPEGDVREIRKRALAIVKTMREQQATRDEIVRATALAAFGEQHAGRVDVRRTIAARDADWAKRGSYRFTRCTIEYLQLTPRASGEFIDCRIAARSASPLVATQAHWPQDLDRAFNDGEVIRGLDKFTFRNTTIEGPSLPMDLLGDVHFDERCTFNGKPIDAAAGR